MEQKKAKVLEQLQIMQDGAQKMIDAGWEYYVLHACCAVEFAKNVQELLQASEDIVRGYAWLALARMGFTRESLRIFERELKRVFDLYDAEDARRVYLRNDM